MGNHARPLARDHSAGCAPKGARLPATEAVFKGDLKRGQRGLVDRAVVLAFRFDCRSRQAARGPCDPGR